MASDDRNTPPTLEQRARRRVALKKGFFIHALVFVLVNGGLYLMSLAAGWGAGAGAGAGMGMGMGSGWGNRYGGGHFYPLWGWALGLAIHGTVVVLRLQGEGLTERMVDREIETLKRRDATGTGSDKPSR